MATTNGPITGTLKDHFVDFDPEEYRLKRTQSLYKWVQGHYGMPWSKLPKDWRDKWLEATGHTSQYDRVFPHRHVDDGITPGYSGNNEFELARNRELHSMMVGDGHNPKIVQISVEWLDGSVTTEDMITAHCHPAGNRASDRCFKCKQEMLEGDAVAEAAMPTIEDLVDQIRDLTDRVSELETANGGNFVRDPFDDHDGLVAMPPTFEQKYEKLMERLVDAYERMAPKPKKAKAKTKKARGRKR